METYDRYSKFRENGKIGIVPFIKIKEKNTDIYIKFSKKKDRMDLLSYKYYYNPNYGWLIMQANPKFGSCEFSIPDDVEIRIPYPLDETLTQYKEEIDKYFKSIN